ncbi:MAG: TauD/TfdA family dioxygenase, partial [bacterium]
SRHPDFIRDLVTHGLTYHHVMPGKDDPTSSMGRSWRSTLSVENRDAAEEKLTTLGYSFSWRAEEDLAVSSPCLPALLTLEDGRRSFFNQLVATRSWRDSRNDPEDALKLGDGRPVSIPLRDEIAELTESYAADLEWQRGDLALLDNHRVQHGRRPFDGRRQVLVAFGARAPTTPFTPPRPLTPVAPVPTS